MSNTYWYTLYLSKCTYFLYIKEFTLNCTKITCVLCIPKYTLYYILSTIIGEYTLQSSQCTCVLYIKEHTLDCKERVHVYSVFVSILHIVV